jgi:O-antigen biosynthesis protein
VHAKAAQPGVNHSADVAIRFPTPERPRFSLVIPVHNHVDATLSCLRSVQANSPLSEMEVIVVDDASTDDTVMLLGALEGLTVVRLESNLGFLGAISAGIAASTGEYMVLLNNDTVVQPGWLDALVEVIEDDVRVGAVGSKLVFPNGRLQEAGCIVWSDATAWNLGYGKTPDAPAYNVRREVDYCSAASLLVRRAAYDAVGGFDRRYTPAYYEDTDLCFSLRKAGYSVIYQPESVVVHQGSLSHPEEPASSSEGHTKLSMEVNRYIFAAKWAVELGRHWPPGTAAGWRGGRIDHRPIVLVSDHHIPAHDQDSGGLRMSWILRLLAELGCRVTLLPLNGLPREPYASDFRRRGIEVFQHPWTVEDLVRERKGLYDLVILSRPTVGEALYASVRSAFPAAPLVYDTVDLHHIREKRRLALTGGQPDNRFRAARRTELRLMRSSDLVATVSEEERREVLVEVPDARTVVLPNVHEITRELNPGFTERSGMIFIGGFDHDPNVDAMLWFVSDVLPLITARWPSHLTIVGSNPPPEILALDSDLITVTGYVPEVAGYFRRALVSVAPLRYGAGVKGKVGQAMSVGVPVVTTRVGSEGVGMVDGVHALVRDDAEGFADAVVRIANDAALWERVAAAGAALIAETMSPDRMRARLAELLARTTRFDHDLG